MQRGRRLLTVTMLALVLLAALAIAGWAQNQPSKLDIPAVWHNGDLWVSVRDAAKTLGFQFQYLPEGQKVEATREGKQAAASVKDGGAWMSGDRRLFVPTTFLEELGYGVRWNPEAHHAVVTYGSQEGLLAPGPKNIAVNLNRQVLFAREGDVVIYKFRVSTGKLGYETPNGDYKVLRKEAMHISNLYPKPDGGAHMPYSLWFTSAYYIHGYQEVPHHPASHGCIRLTIPNAKTLYDWTPVGTPVNIYRNAAQD